MVFPILAIDYGKKHIGVAVSDFKGIVATPLPVIHLTQKRGIRGVLEDISSICNEYRIKSLLIGMPQAFIDAHKKTQNEIAEFIKEVIKETGLEYETIDESFSTTEAQNMLLSTGQRTKGSRRKIDSVTAALLLQEYLDKLSKNKYEVE